MQRTHNRPKKRTSQEKERNPNTEELTNTCPYEDSWFLGFLVCWVFGSLISWFLGFLFLWFLVFSVSWFLGVLVCWLLASCFLVFWFKASWYLGVLLSKFQSFKVSEMYFRFRWRCRSHITKVLFHVFWKMLIPY